MTAFDDLPQVGAANPEQRNSPVFEEDSAEELSLDPGLDEGVCYFNSETFQIGSYVCSGDALLRCMAGGAWVREGACRR